ncbi:MAG: phosphogluconate dehydratase [Pseudomonadales bacterium]
MHNDVEKITREIIERSKASREAYLDMLDNTEAQSPAGSCLSCSNMAHVIAASPAEDKDSIAQQKAPNIGIVTAYNDMLSAHQPLATYPDRIKNVAREHGATAQVAGGVPAMCDGVTQGQPGMELSLFSRDVIAMATAVSLTHNVFDAVACLGVCDKIVPGLLMGALQFGHLPAVFIPAGPMPSGISNSEKAHVRKQYAAGEVDEIALFDVEAKSYHSAGTCTFYGTANSNQLLMEMLGVQLPSTSFINTGTALRDELTDASIVRLLQAAKNKVPLSAVVTEKSLVNAVVGLLATGGSTNHTLHLVAIARAAGIDLRWSDMAVLSAVVPLLARVYPNGSADVNHFRDAGGIAFIVQQLRTAGLLNEDTINLMGEGLDAYTREPVRDGSKLGWSAPVSESRNEEVLRPAAEPFDTEGGIKLLEGNIGAAVVKISAVDPEFRAVTAPCVVFTTQKDMQDAFQAGELDRDVVVVVRFQGPAANGMPELHKLTPALSVLQDKGFKVALLTDGRMSGASGKVLAAIHVTPEAMHGGMIGKLRDGDVITVDANKGLMNVDATDSELAKRDQAVIPKFSQTLGRNLFTSERLHVGAEEAGASFIV